MQTISILIPLALAFAGAQAAPQMPPGCPDGTVFPNMRPGGSGCAIYQCAHGSPVMLADCGHNIGCWDDAAGIPHCGIP